MTVGEVERKFILSRMNRDCASATITFYQRANLKINQFIGFAFGGRFADVVTAIDEEADCSSECGRERAIGERVLISVWFTELRTFYS